MSDKRAGDSEVYEGKSERVTDPLRIIGLLTRIKENRALLTVSLPDSSGLFNSAILEIRPTSREIILDELNPKDGHALFLQKRRFSAHTRLKGVELDFSGELAEAADSPDGAYYRVPFPALVHYLQRRNHYRARVGLGRHVPVTFMLGSGEMVKGELNDISLGGIGVRLAPGAGSALTSGAVIPQCRIELPSKEEVLCEVAICFINIGVHEKLRIAGARFIALSHAQQNTISRYIAELDRELRRKMGGS